jgi:osmotically-inducible protein OsmY
MNLTLRQLVIVSAIALALGSVGTVLAVEASPREPVAHGVGDARHETQILTSFNTNRHLRGYDLTVKVHGDRAIIGGEVEDAIAKELAEKIALGAEDIKTVDNRIVVDAKVMPKQRSADRQSFGDKVVDATTTASIKSKLLWNSHTDASDIHVETLAGKVVLTGTAATAAEKSLAGRIALDTEAVLGVDNLIKLTDKPMAATGAKAAGERIEQHVSDAWITAKVKSSLMLTRSVDAFDITVSTAAGRVTLDGVVHTAAERDLAVDVARDVRGVKNVESKGLKAV